MEDSQKPANRICIDYGNIRDRTDPDSTCCTICEYWHAISPCRKGHRVGINEPGLHRSCIPGKPCSPCSDFTRKMPEKREGPVVFREKLDPNKVYPLKDFCWKCLDEGYASTATVTRYGNPLCDDHKNVDPECMEGVFIRLLKHSG